MDISENKKDGGLRVEPPLTPIIDVPEEMPLSPAARLFTAPKFNCYIIAVLGIKTKVDTDIIKEGLKHSLIKHPRFSSKLVAKDGGRMKWSPTEVDVENHVTVPDLEPEMESPDQFVDNYISNLTTFPMDMSKPPWELHILNVRTHDAEATTVLRLHHSIGDGMSLISLVLACCRKTSDPDALPSLPKSKRRADSASSRGLWWLLFTIWTMLRIILNTLVDLGWFMATIFFLKDTKTPLKGGPGVGQNPKRLVHRTVSLNDIKIVKNALNMTINDVVFGITEAGLSRYLNREYAKENEETNSNQKLDYLPKKIRLRATILVNVRPNTGIQELADMMSKKSKAKWGNKIGYICIPFTIALRKDPLDYLRRAKATMDRKKQSLEGICSFLTNSLLIKFVGAEATAALAYRALFNTTMSFSNVVGPAEEISFYGHPLAFMAPSVYGHPQALTIHYQSYNDKVTIVLTVDPSVISDPHLLCNDLEDSLKIMKDVVTERGLVNNARC